MKKIILNVSDFFSSDLGILCIYAIGAEIADKREDSDDSDLSILRTSLKKKRFD